MGNILKLKKNFIEKCKDINSLNKKLLKSGVKGKKYFWKINIK